MQTSAICERQDQRPPELISAVECGVLTAGGRVMLALVHSWGRAEAHLLSITPQITWRRVDGRVEGLSPGDVGDVDFASLQRELLGGGLLVGEYAQDLDANEAPQAVWLLKKGASRVC